MIDNETLIKFASELIPLIKSGEKTLTYRLGNNYESLSVGDVVYLSDNYGQHLAQAKIVEKSKTVFKDIPLDRKGHEIYKDEEDKNKTFERYYKREIEPNEPVTVLGYEVIKFL